MVGQGTFQNEALKGESNPTFRSHEKKKKKTKVESKRNKNKASLQLEPL